MSEVSSGQLEQQQQEAPALGSGAQLLANKEAILSLWQSKFESIVSEDANVNAAAQSEPASSSPSSALGPASSSSSAPGAPGQPPVPLLPQQQQQLTKEQLYQMFQNILSIKKFEHQLLYNALQLDSADEQAAAIRRELDGRVARIAELERNKKLLPKFVLKEMESLSIEETRMAVNKLMVNLDSLPVIKAGGAASGLVGPLGSSGAGSQAASSSAVYSGLQKFRRYNSR